MNKLANLMEENAELLATIDSWDNGTTMRHMVRCETMADGNE
jgi:acyl-CoA reductase-like NAD-dependent aldehyde dehydrogenase